MARRNLAYSGRSLQRDNPDPEDIAIERGALVAEAIFHMAAVRSLYPEGRLPQGRISCVAAEKQLTNATSGNQAAHLLPGHIHVGVLPIEHLAVLPRWCVECDRQTRNTIAQISPNLRACFGQTNSIPACFNAADSRAEQMPPGAGPGLKELFAESVQAMWTHARVLRERLGVIDYRNVINALSIWFGQVNDVYRRAEQLKRAAARAASDPSVHRRRTGEANVLAGYVRGLQVASNRIPASGSLVGTPARFVCTELGCNEQGGLGYVFM